MTADPSSSRVRIALAVVVLLTIALGILSVRQVVTRVAVQPVFDGVPGLSADWAPPPLSGDWVASAGIAPPPPGAVRDELMSWLATHYPVLALDVPEKREAPPSPRIDLGGGPPRDLAVEPGVGLVLREP